MSDEALAAGVASRRPRRSLLDSERLLAVGGLTPAVAYIVALVGFPFVLAVLMAFSDVTVGDPSLDFVGLETLRQVLEDPVFWRALRNTLFFTVVSNALVVILATALALILTKDFKFKWLIRLLVLLPWTTPVSLATISWLWTLDTIFSPIDWVLRQLGLLEGNMIWLGQPRLALASVIIVHTWRIVPLAAVIVMAGMLAIPTEIRDASDIDGAGFWRRTFEIEIPLMAPIIGVAVLFGVILSVTDMTVVHVLTRGGPTNYTQVLASWAFYKGIEGGDLAQGAGTALFLLPVLVAVAALILRFARRREVL